MSKRQDVWLLLLARIDTWVSRGEIDFVGGHEGTRRMREIRYQLPPGFVLDERTMRDGTKAYRLRSVETPKTEDGEAEDPEYHYCTGCHQKRRKALTEASIDSRYRLADCTVCGSRTAWTRAPA